MVLLWAVPLLLYVVYITCSKMFLSLIGIGVLIYLFFYLICVIIFDCDIALAFTEMFGKPIGALKGKVVFITGASAGIGEYVALALAKHGVKLVLTARRKNELERVKTECLAASYGQLTSDDILVIQMDVLKYEEHQQIWDEAVRHFGHVDILLNNAGRSQRANWENIDLAVDREMFELNVFAVVHFSRIAVRYYLKENKKGHIAVTSSATGVVGVPYSASYTGTKYAIHGYFNALRSEKSLDDITVTLLCPGPTYTSFLAHCFTEHPGQTYGQTHNATDKRMMATRCGHLCAIALANKLNESWMAVFPIIPMMYVAVYCPVFYKLFMKIMGPKRILKLRDNKENLDLPTGNVDQ